MRTELRSTYYVAICDETDALLFQVVWGIVIYDERQIFKPGDYVSSSEVREFDLDLGYFYTQSGTHYIATNGVTSCQLDLKEYQYLRAGLSPPEIQTIVALEREGHGKLVGLIYD